ncbi:hypothetical protein BGW41_006427, partial [Actinomortierella wolfii]
MSSESSTTGKAQRSSKIGGGASESFDYGMSSEHDQTRYAEPMRAALVRSDSEYNVDTTDQGGAIRQKEMPDSTGISQQHRDHHASHGHNQAASIGGPPTVSLFPSTGKDQSPGHHDREPARDLASTAQYPDPQSSMASSGFYGLSSMLFRKPENVTGATTLSSSSGAPTDPSLKMQLGSSTSSTHPEHASTDTSKIHLGTLLRDENVSVSAPTTESATSTTAKHASSSMEPSSAAPQGGQQSSGTANLSAADAARAAIAAGAASVGASVGAPVRHPIARTFSPSQDRPVHPNETLPASASTRRLRASIGSIPGSFPEDDHTDHYGSGNKHNQSSSDSKDQGASGSTAAAPSFLDRVRSVLKGETSSSQPTETVGSNVSDASALDTSTVPVVTASQAATEDGASGASKKKKNKKKKKKSAAATVAALPVAAAAGVAATVSSLTQTSPGATPSAPDAPGVTKAKTLDRATPEMHLDDIFGSPDVGSTAIEQEQGASLDKPSSVTGMKPTSAPSAGLMLGSLASIGGQDAPNQPVSSLSKGIDTT